MQQENEYQLIFSYLRSLNFHFLDTWVIECINYYKSNYPNISIENLKNEVKQQWLLVNLREIKVPSLPPNLKLKDKIILDGAYAVQVESMIDSSRSCYSQLKNILKDDTGNIEDSEKPEDRDVKPNRCLTFVITDGVQEIQAMEYQLIKKIKTDDPELLPGFKMVILGPVECRKGMILLKDENVRLCGGEVDTLTATNKLKNLLIRRLGFDESDYPDSTYLENRNENQPPLSNESNVNDNVGVESLLSQNDDLFLNIPLESEILAQNQPLRENNDQNFIDEYEIPEENVISYEGTLNQENRRIINKKHNLPQEEMEVSFQKRISLDPEVINGRQTSGEDSAFYSSFQSGDEDIFTGDFYKTQSNANSSLKAIKPVQTKLSSFFKTSNVNNDKLLENNQNPLCVNDEPFVYLKHIMTMSLNEPTVFTVKAIILTLKKKITIEEDEFNLKVNITDGSSCLDVDICSAILEDFLGYSPCEMSVMLKAKQTNSAISQKIKESFSKAQEKLIHLNCLMKIKFFTLGRCPLILSLEEVTARHLEDLKKRS